tara:strand:+ start:876 stop:1097 length:222 start_codon:yes stop_codon:yes gene_type:complete
MTSKEFVAFLKGMAVVIEGTPNEEQWATIIKTLIKVKDGDDNRAFVQEIKEEVEKFVKPIIKKFPGSPPDIFM